MYNTKEKTNKIRVGITHGDFNGISYEIIIKTFKDNLILNFFTPVVYGSSKIASYYRKTLNMPDVNFNLIKRADLANPKRANIINCYDREVKIEMGKLTDSAGELAYLALEKAISDIDKNTIDVLVTAPINKVNIQSENFNFAGHTGYFADKYKAKNHLMLMVSNKLRIGIITGHIPLKDVSAAITEELVLENIRVMQKTLQMDFAIPKPKIAVLGLNPHAGDGGLIGTEDKQFIMPAISKATSEGILVFGPYPSDGFFGSSNYTKFDGILAMYHDQGMLPFKTYAFDNGVNFTAGLPIIRTSPAHGTAFDIAGQNIASPDSFKEAIFLAIELHKNRTLYKELTKSPLPVKENGNKKR